MTISYIVGNSLYLNITNRCTNRCDFCIRNNGDGAYGSDSLWLEHEPTAGEIIMDLSARQLSQFEELVFCGYGEPTIRLDELLATAEWVKQSSTIPIRINTNGQANLIHKKDITPLLAGLVDTLSISLNAPDSESYMLLCHSDFDNAYQGLLEFTTLSKRYVPEVILSVVSTGDNSAAVEKCKDIAKELGVPLRVREYIG